MPRNLTSKPSYLSSHESETGKVEGVDFGWDATGMWFTGDAGSGAGGEGDGTGGYPVRTSFLFESGDTCEVTYTVDYQGGCSDQGICLFVDGVNPEWQWGTNETRIALSMNCPQPYIYGREGDTNGEGGELEGGEGGSYSPNYYTFRLSYDPTAERVEATVYEGEGVGGAVVGTLALDERLPEGPYRIGFSADEDEFGEKSYFVSLEILKNGESVTSSSYTYEFSNGSPETMPNYRYGGPGNLDTTVYENEAGQRVSRQRTGYFEIVNSSGGRKVVEVFDGETVDDTVDTPDIDPNPTGNPNVSDSGSTI